MLNLIDIMIAALLYYTGIVKLARWWTWKAEPQLVILGYHRAGAGGVNAFFAGGKHLRQQMLYLKRHYRVSHLEHALEELSESSYGRLKDDRRTLLALTFDDGYHDNYTDGFALAREMQMPITIFLVPENIESGSRFWWNEPYHLLAHSKVNEVVIDGCTYALHRPDGRRAFIQATLERLRYAPSVAEREAFLAMLGKLLAVSCSTLAEEKPTLPLTWQEICEMEESGWVSFGGHTMHHPVLGYLADPGEVLSEVKVCREVLEKQLGHAVRIFAYPYGKQEHIGENGLRAVQQAGYTWAVTTIHGSNTTRSERLLLRRIVVDVDQHWLVVAAKASGAWDLFVGLLKLPGTLIKAIVEHNRRQKIFVLE